MAMWAETVITLLRSSWGAVFLPPLLTVFFFLHHSISSRCINTKRDHLLHPSPLSLPRLFAGMFYLLYWINVAPQCRLRRQRLLVGGCRATGFKNEWMPATSRPPTASSQDINQLWFKLWYRKIISPQSVYLRSANKHHMLWGLSCSSKLWWSWL